MLLSLLYAHGRVLARHHLPVLGEVMLSYLDGLSLLPPPAEILCGKLNYHVQKHHKPHLPAGFWLAQCLSQTLAAPVVQV